MPRNSFDNRRTLLAKVHIAKKDLRLEDDAYRAILATLGVATSAELDLKGLERLLAHFAKLGWAPTSTPAKRKPKPRATPGTGPLLDKIGALLADAGRPWAYAEAMARRMYQVERLEWAKAEHLRGIIAALTKDAQRRVKRDAGQAGQEARA